MADFSEQPNVGSPGATSGGRLSDLFLAHRGNVSDKWEQYLAIYEAELASFVARGKPVRLLEIGVQNGGSLEIWRSYLPPGSSVVGIDIDPACAQLTLGDGIRVLIGDVSDSATLDRLLGDAVFDIVVDDGSHRSEHIIAAFESCWGRVAPGGLFIIEDLHCSYFGSHGGGFRKPNAAMEHFKALADAVNSDHFEADAAQQASPAELDRLRALGRSVARVTFYDSLTVVQRAAEARDAPYRRVMTGQTAPVAALSSAVPYLPMAQLRSLLLSSAAAEAFEPALRASVIAARETAEALRETIRAQRETIAAELALQQTLTARRESEWAEERARATAQLAVHQDAADRLQREVEQAAAELALQQTLTARRESEWAEERARAAYDLARLYAIEASETWRATRPVRQALTWWPGFAVFIRRATKVVWWAMTLQLAPRLWSWRAARRVNANAPATTAAMTVPDATEADVSAAIAPLPVLSQLPHGPPAREEAVDIVVCVHNALDDVQRCLASIKRHTMPPYRLILVDDGSAVPTQDFLQSFARVHGALLIRHEEARGYTLAANAGLRVSDAPLILLLNSDTEVTDGWLDRMADLLHRNPDVGLVGPLSNIASWQSTPLLMDGNDWARNELPEDVTSDDVARIVAAGASRRGVDIGFLNGFCLLIRRRVLEGVGYFDEETFGAGYGEENDFCIRARQAGWKLMVAEDAYVLHHQSRSYGDERRLALARRANVALTAKHNFEQHIGPQVCHARDSLLLEHARQRVRVGLMREGLAKNGRSEFEGKRIGIMLPVADAGGGANVILQEALAARDFGVDTWIINKVGFSGGFRNGYPDLDLPVLLAPDDDVARFVEEAVGDLSLDAVIATAAGSFDWLPAAREGLRLGYYIQDLETMFFDHGSTNYVAAASSYRQRPDVRRFTKTAWNAEAVREFGGLQPIVIGPSVDVALFRPNSDRGLNPTATVRVTAMVRTSTPRRSPALTLRVLRSLKDAFGDHVSVSCFGSTPIECASLGVPLDGIRCYGVLTPSEIAVLFGEVDVFLDFSVWQAMGLTGLEAMASGVAVVMPQTGGAPEFCEDGVNGLIVDTANPDACLGAARRLVEDAQLRFRLRHAGLRASHDFPPARASLNVLKALFAQ